MSQYATQIDCIRRYHQQTKHRLEKYANGPETLDWSDQPNPYRRYEGSTQIPLPFSKPELETGYCQLYQPDKIAHEELNLTIVGSLLELSMGLAAWKEYHGDRWALRCNPSSGNLHPTEAYVITTGLEDLAPGVYHYAPLDHTLEQRCRFSSADDAQPVEQLFIGLSSVFWREAWKYGERAFRYCQLDTGHALAAIRYASALFGMKAELVTDVDDTSIENLLGLNRDNDYGDAEREHPDLLLRITPLHTAPQNYDIAALVSYSQKGSWSGIANILDTRHLYQWPIIDDVAQAARTIQTSKAERWTAQDLPSPLPCKTQLPAKLVIQRRRSAQKFDGITGIQKEEFFRILDMLVPRPDTPPWDALPCAPKIHLVLFVHRVEGLDPGLYMFLRHDQVLESLKTALTDKLEWQPVESAPSHLNLYRLIKANAQKAAATLSCHQRIASDSAFSLGMVSEFDNSLEAGPWTYKHLYWEAGMIGQVLYLEAEAIDLQGTGIGCFFDDPVHEMLGIKDTQFQSMYHFTVGGALNDSRLRTLLPYGHLKRD